MIDRSIINGLSIASFVFAFTHFAITGDAILFFQVFGFSCMFLYAANLLPVKHHYFFYSINTVGFFFTFNNLVDEWFFNVEKLQINEYVFALLTITFVVSGRKKIRKQTYAQYFKGVTFRTKLETEYTTNGYYPVNLPGNNSAEIF